MSALHDHSLAERIGLLVKLNHRSEREAAIAMRVPQATLNRAIRLGHIGSAFDLAIIARTYDVNESWLRQSDGVPPRKKVYGSWELCYRALVFSLCFDAALTERLLHLPLDDLGGFAATVGIEPSAAVRDKMFRSFHAAMEDFVKRVGRDALRDKVNRGELSRRKAG